MDEPPAHLRISIRVIWLHLRHCRFFWLCAVFACSVIFRCGDVSLAVSNLDMHALFVLGDLRAKLVKQFQSRFVYITEQNAEGIYVAEIDTESALVVDDKPGLKLKVGDHFSASVLPSREGGKLEIKFRDIKLTVYGLGDYAFVTTADGHAIVFKEGHNVVTVFA